MSEQLYTCPACQRTGFLARGLTAHECPTLGRRLSAQERLYACGHVSRPASLVNFAVGPAPAALGAPCEALAEEGASPAPVSQRLSPPAVEQSAPAASGFTPQASSLSPQVSSALPMSTNTTETTLRPATALPDHPLLAHIPVWQASEPEFQSLKASIIARGLDYPVLIDSSSRVVDGRNRRNACAAAGLPVPTRTVPDAEVPEVILSSLGNRRHVTKGAMAYLLAPLMKPAVEASRARRTANVRPDSPLSGLSGSVTVEALADGYGFGRTMLFQALELHKLFATTPDLRLQFEERILTGELGLGGAIQAIAGKLATEGKPRRVDPPAALITRAFTDLRNRWAGWANVPTAERDEVKAQVVAAAPEWPADLAAATAAAWRKAGLIS